MLLASILFLIFTLWTLFHWQELPKLLKNEAAGVEWPLSIHHTATPARLVVVTSLHLLFAFCLFQLTVKVLSLTQLPSPWLPWIALVLLIALLFAPLTSQLGSYVRYYFQQHLFFPPLPSHQEDAIISVLMTQAENHDDAYEEINHLHKLLKSQFRNGLHGPNVISLRDEKALVRREFRQMMDKEIFRADHKLSEIERQQIRFHLYSCYRLLARVVLSRHWSGRDRRKAFRELGYNINTGDGSFYSGFRRLRHSFNHYVLQRGKHTKT